MERVERIKHLNVRGFWAQGIVSADAGIRTFTWFKPANCAQTTTGTALKSTKCEKSVCRIILSSYRLLRTTRHPGVEPSRLFFVISIVSSLEFPAASRMRHTDSPLEQTRLISIVRSSRHLDDCVPEHAKS
jgi:hypothetical protein